MILCKDVIYHVFVVSCSCGYSVERPYLFFVGNKLNKSSIAKSGAIDQE